jgi:hypothetical protein
MAGSALALCICQSNLAAEADKLEREPVESIMIEETLTNRGGEFSLRLIVAHEPSEGGAIRELRGIELNPGLTDLLDAILATLGRDEPEKEPKSEKIGDETWDAQHDSLVRRRRSWTHNQLTGSSPAS